MPGGRRYIRSTTLTTFLALAALGAAAIPNTALKIGARRTSAQIAAASTAHASDGAVAIVTARRRDDFAAMQTFRPGYPFWQHVFTLPDHSIAFGSIADGRLLATFPARGNWTREGVWTDPALAHILDGHRLSRKLSERREQVALLLERTDGPVLHNATRGDALRPNAVRYGRFLAEWSAIYERFGDHSSCRRPRTRSPAALAGSHLCAEMVFGNTFIVRNLIASTPQVRIYAMRTPRTISLAEIMKRTGLPADEVRRFNPALGERVPAQALLYLPGYISELVLTWRSGTGLQAQRIWPCWTNSCGWKPVLNGGTTRPSPRC